ncbi:hypothetical protein DFH08DRAFT_812879 [Mycena albidolilacea]|uniref:Uncharacterized protein n=1 Tax=Mycena albidolilacea TaxID=1033008 RepID=A0AAD6ZU13_9AGAR|nr:hypothetical protein DFH08DRAFT_812879 [Mycena albidolilacea]
MPAMGAMFIHSSFLHAAGCVRNSPHNRRARPPRLTRSTRMLKIRMRHILMLAGLTCKSTACMKMRAKKKSKRVSRSIMVSGVDSVCRACVIGWPHLDSATRTSATESSRRRNIVIYGKRKGFEMPWLWEELREAGKMWRGLCRWLRRPVPRKFQGVLHVTAPSEFWNSDERVERHYTQTKLVPGADMPLEASGCSGKVAKKIQTLWWYLVIEYMDGTAKRSGSERQPASSYTSPLVCLAPYSTGLNLGARQLLSGVRQEEKLLVFSDRTIFSQDDSEDGSLKISNTIHPTTLHQMPQTAVASQTWTGSEGKWGSRRVDKDDDRMLLKATEVIGPGRLALWHLRPSIHDTYFNLTINVSSPCGYCTANQSRTSRPYAIRFQSPCGARQLPSTSCQVSDPDIWENWWFESTRGREIDISASHSKSIEYLKPTRQMSPVGELVVRIRPGTYNVARLTQDVGWRMNHLITMTTSPQPNVSELVSNIQLNTGRTLDLKT